MHPLDKFRYCPLCSADTFEKNSPRSKKCSICGFEYYANTSAAVAALIFNEHGEILLTRRAYAPAKNTLDLPGGFIEIGETAEEALKREIKEELGIDVYSLEFKFTIPNEYPYSNIVINTIDIFFKAEIRDINNIRPADDVESFDFYPVKEIDIDEIGLASIKKAIARLKKHRL